MKIPGVEYNGPKSPSRIPGGQAFAQQGPDIGISQPTQTSFQQVLPSVKNALGEPATLEKVASIPGYDDSFFNNLFDESRRRLEKQTYGTGGIQERATENLASRGLLGSSVEQGARGQISDQFNEQLGSVLSDLNRLKQESFIQEAQQQRALQQERDVKNAEFNTAMQELGIRSALTQASDINKFNIGTFENQVKLEEIARENEQNRRRLLLDLLSSPQVDLGGSQADAVLDAIFSGTNVDRNAALVNPQVQQYQWYVNNRGWTTDGINFKNGMMPGIPAQY